MKLYGDKDNFRTQKVLIAAKVAGKDVKIAGKVPPANTFPLGLAPALEHENVHLFGADAISSYLTASNAQYNPQKQHETVQWTTWAEGQLLPAVLAYVLPSVSAAKVDAATLSAAKVELLAQLKAFNALLLTKTFLVGEHLTVADVSVALNLLPAYQYVLDKAARNDLPNVTRYFQTIVNQPHVKEIVGEVTLIEKAVTFDDKTYQTLTAKAAPAPKEKKKEEKPKAEKKKKEVEPEEELDAADAALAAQPKFVDPFQSMPAGTFVMDAFKRVYSNEDTATKAIPWFWENFDADNYSIWFCEYKFPEELTLTFMSANLISGMFQRLEKLRKHGFGSVCLFGENNNSTISGIWMWRGHELAFELSPDWQVDYESYTWQKLDAKAESTKKLVNEYLLWEGDFGGKKFNQGKIFK